MGSTVDGAVGLKWLGGGWWPGGLWKAGCPFEEDRRSCCLSKSLLSHFTASEIASLRSLGSGKVRRKSFTLSCNPYWNWSINATWFQDVSHANNQNSDAYTAAGRDP